MLRRQRQKTREEIDIIKTIARKYLHLCGRVQKEASKRKRTGLFKTERKWKLIRKNIISKYSQFHSNNF